MNFKVRLLSWSLKEFKVCVRTQRSLA